MVIKWYLLPTKSEGTSKYEPNFFAYAETLLGKKRKKCLFFLAVLYFLFTFVLVM